MVTDKLTSNAKDLETELDWFARVLETRFKLYFDQESHFENIYEIEPPEYEANSSVFSDFLQHYQLSVPERLCLLLAMAPHVRPQLLDSFFVKNASYDRGFTEFGGLRGQSHGGFLPTGETLVFLASGGKLESRFHALQMFGADHFFARHNIVRLDAPHPEEPVLSGPLRINQEFVELFTTGQVRKPNFSTDFPARLITTELTWEDLVLDEETMLALDEIESWIRHGETLMREWGMQRKLRPGLRCLFYGPPGTGKTMTACLLGKSTGRDVYRIDLSTVVSKYIGETEKNLSKVFDMAENKQWILFFDEADALFGKRTKVEDAHDRYANQEVSYLLQRIEVFNGMVVLASNFKSNLDDAFTRRFESIIHFPTPKEEDRLKLWSQGFSSKSTLGANVNLRRLAAQYELSGGAIINIVRYASLAALNRNSTSIELDDLEEGIKKEYAKEGRTV